MTPSVHPDHWSNGPCVGARGVVIVNGLILFLKYQQDDETAYLFPGGGHEPGEMLAVHEYQPSKRVDTADDIRAIRCFQNTFELFSRIHNA